MRAIIAAMALSCGSAAATAAPPPEKPRLIVLTDIGNEPDDSESMVRLLTYANEFDIEALVATTSTHQRERIQPALIEERIRAYGQVVDNLRRHAPGYPDAATLMARVRRGAPLYGMANVAPGRLSEGAKAIIAAADRRDARPVWITVWGGAADLAQALSHVRATRTPAATDAFVAKLRVYSISDQDDAGPWLRVAFPRLFWIASIHGFGQYALAAWSGISGKTPGADPDIVSNDWLTRNVRSKGPLGALYPAWLYLMEGDTPSFLYLIPNGLGSPEHPEWGSWGGRYTPVSPTLGLRTDVRDTATAKDGTTVTSNQATVWRWRTAFQQDFAARMAWSVTPDPKAANHPPIVMLNGQAGQDPVEIATCPGRPVPLSAEGSRDPDGDRLTLRWWWYAEATGERPPRVTLSRAEGATTEATVAAPRPNTVYPLRLHVILEATDDGTPALTRYRRAVLRIDKDAAACR